MLVQNQKQEVEMQSDLSEGSRLNGIKTSDLTAHLEPKVWNNYLLLMI